MTPSLHLILVTTFSLLLSSNIPASAGESGDICFPDRQWQTATPESQGIPSKAIQDIISHLDRICGRDGTEQVVIIRNGYLLWAGPRVKERQIVWSCSKSFLSICLGLLWDDGKCTPQTLAAEWLPAMKTHYPAVTLEHLATFTSGYRHKPEGLFTPDTPRFPPGTRFHYSRESDVLSYILTRIGQQTLYSLFRHRIADPIGIPSSDFTWGVVGKTPEGLDVNGGYGKKETGVMINALAMARVGWLFCNDGVWDGRRLISHRYIAYATSPRVSSNIPPHDPKAWYTLLPGNYGLNWWVHGVKANGKRMWPHAPEGTFAAQGNKNNICLIIPAWKTVIVRLGQDKIINTDLYDGVFAILSPYLNAANSRVTKK